MTVRPRRPLPADGRFPRSIGPTPLVPLRLEAGRRLEPGAQVVTLFPDRMERDFSTEPLQPRGTA